MRYLDLKLSRPQSKPGAISRACGFLEIARMLRAVCQAVVWVVRLRMLTVALGGMQQFRYRQVTQADVDAMSELRSRSGWSGGASRDRMLAYFRGEHHPKQALLERVGYVADSDGVVTAFIAGHLTTRFGCAGELQWILVGPEARGLGVADTLWLLLKEWFQAHAVLSVCVNVEPENAHARAFYARQGAEVHACSWMIWRDLTQSYTVPRGTMVAK